MFTCSFCFILCLTTVKFLFSQDKPQVWEIGVLGFSARDATGVPFGDFNKGDRGIAYTFHIARSISPYFDIGLHSGLSLRSEEKLSFDDISDIDLLLRYSFLYKKPLGSRQFLRPYLLVGASMNFLKNRGTGTNLSTPIGFGSRIRFGEQIDLDLNFSFKNDLTGFRDYATINVGSVVYLGKTKKPDMDDDGTPDEGDKCPYIAGPANMLGCPDTDGDSWIDPLDACPKLAGKLNGCPDADADGIADIEDECPQKSGLESLNGCPDTDADGIADHKDVCPEAYGSLNMQGCPDTDADGLADMKDDCPRVPGLKAFNGCPDTDMDGIVDAEDRCPNEAGIASMKGCPEMEESVSRTLDDAVQAVQFAQNYARLLPSSYPVLDTLTSIMIRKPQYKLFIDGHTDSYGDAAKNQDLSEQRARRCEDYLVEKGVDPQRIVSLGHGESLPLVPNTSRKNRALNRRVEFKLLVE